MVLPPQKPTFPYSAERARNEALKVKIARNKIFCKGNNPDFAIAHPDWCRDAKQNNYVVMIKQTTELYKKNEKVWRDRAIRRQNA